VLQSSLEIWELLWIQSCDCGRKQIYSLPVDKLHSTVRTKEISLQVSVAKSVSTKKLAWAFNKAVFLYIINTYFPSPKESSFHYKLSFTVKQSAPISCVRNTCEGEYSSALVGNRAAVTLQKLWVDWAPKVTNEKGFFSNGWWLLADFWSRSLLSLPNPFYNYHL